MGLLELFLLAVGLSMDAFAVSVCKGMAQGRPSVSASAIAGLWFGGFQALMPLIGYLAGIRFSSYIEAVDHWIAFILLGLIGINMIREAADDEKADAGFHWKEMLILAIATSIDALAVGVTFAFLNVNILPAVTLIGVTTFVISAAGVFAGNIVGMKWKARAARLGGVILILIGIKILMEHLGLLFWLN